MRQDKSNLQVHDEQYNKEWHELLAWIKKRHTIRRHKRHGTHTKKC